MTKNIYLSESAMVFSEIIDSKTTIVLFSVFYNIYAIRLIFLLCNIWFSSSESIIMILKFIYVDITICFSYDFKIYICWDYNFN